MSDFRHLACWGWGFMGKWSSAGKGCRSRKRRHRRGRKKRKEEKKLSESREGFTEKGTSELGLER